MLKSRIPEITRGLVQRADNVNEQSAKRIAESARQRVPVATGATRDTIDTIEARAADGGGYQVVVGHPGHILEFGSVKHGARPFMVPSAEAERETHLRAIAALFR